jgi:pilus assembly protein CpaB
MRSRIALLVVLALLCAGGASYLVLKQMQQMHQPAQLAAPATTMLLVATRDLPSGSIIGPADTRAVSWPVESVPPGGMPPDSIVFGETVVRVPIAQNAPIIDTQIIHTSEGGALAYVVSPGRVALAIAVGTNWGSTAVAGHVTAGTYVDIVYVHSLLPSEMTDQSSTDSVTQVAETLLVGVKVLAVDLQINDVHPEAQVTLSVTVEVSPKEAEMLVLAGANVPGVLTLALNSAIEPTPADLLKVADVRRGAIPSYTTETELSAVFAPVDSDPADDEEAQPVAHTVFVFRGSLVQEVSMPAGMGAARGDGRHGGEGPESDLLEASGPSSTAPVGTAQGDADQGDADQGDADQGDAEEPALPPQPAAAGTTAGETPPQSLLPATLDLRGGS